MIYSRGTPLEDIPADFRGQPIEEWHREQITEQCNEAIRSQDPGFVKHMRNIHIPRKSKAVAGGGE